MCSLKSRLFSSLFVVGVCVLMILSGRLASAGEKLSIAVGEWPPYLTTEQRHGGVVAHLIKDVFLEEGYDLEFVVLPWARVYLEASVGRYDMTGVWMHKIEREEDFYFSQAVLTERFVFFHLRESRFSWQTLDDLQGLKIGGDLEYSYGSVFDELLKLGTLRMDRVSTVKQNFNKLLLGRLDIYPQEVNVGYANLKHLLSPEQVNHITHHPKQFLDTLSYVLFPKKRERSKLLLTRFNQRLKQFKKDGRYQAYFEALQNGAYDR